MYFSENKIDIIVNENTEIYKKYFIELIVERYVTSKTNKTGPKSITDKKYAVLIELRRPLII
jgi:hypothetical protein